MCKNILLVVSEPFISKLIILTACLFFKDAAATTAATPTSKGKRSKRDKGGKKDDDEKEKDRASPEATPATAQEQMAAMRESGNMISLVPTVGCLLCLLLSC